MRSPRRRPLEHVGLPEAQLNLSQAAIHLATAPKSNRSALAIWNARTDVQNGAIGEVPPHLRDAHYKGAQSLGHGVGYDYPHDHPEGWMRPAVPAGCPARQAATTNRASTEQRQTWQGEWTRRKMTAGELAVVMAAVLCCIGFAALDRRADARARHDAIAARRSDVVARRDPAVAAPSCGPRPTPPTPRWPRPATTSQRFDRVLGSAEAISDAVVGGSRVARAALSTPVIKTAALATGTSRAVRRLRRKERRSA